MRKLLDVAIMPVDHAWYGLFRKPKTRNIPLASIVANLGNGCGWLRVPAQPDAIVARSRSQPRIAAFIA